MLAISLPGRGCVLATMRVQANAYKARRGIGSPWLHKLLVEAAHAAAHTKNTYLSAQYHRIAARRGAKTAMIAVGHTLLTVISHMLVFAPAVYRFGRHLF